MSKNSLVQSVAKSIQDMQQQFKGQFYNQLNKFPPYKSKWMRKFSKIHYTVYFLTK